MRRILDGLYRASGAAAALFLGLIFVIIITQVAFNTIDRLAGLILGQAFGLAIPSYSDIAGFFLAATSFLGLASTLKSGNLIRVNLVLQRLGAPARRVIELFGSALGSLIAGYSTYYSINLAMDAWHYNELSTGIIAIPMWIPQLTLIAGLGALTIAFVDGFICCLRYGTLIEPQEDQIVSGHGGKS